MGGRRSQHDKERDRGREQSRKPVRGNARGHGAHHRHERGRGAPHKLSSGKDRTMDTVRRPQLFRMGDEELAELSAVGKKSDVERSIEESSDAAGFGATLQGERGKGVVVEVRKGNFLTRLNAIPPAMENAIPRVVRTIVRGTLQQFDLGLSSLVAPGDEVDLIIPPLPNPGDLHQY